MPSHVETVSLRRRLYTGLVQHGRPIARALFLRYAGWVLMMALALYAESRPAPHLPDGIIDRVPYLAWVDRNNHWLLALSYLPVGCWLLAHSPAAFCRYNVSAGLLSLVRGLCIAATGLGPVRGADVHANTLPLFGPDYWSALLDLSSPWGLLVRNTAHVHLTKDLFFSGHTASTLLLLLYVWPYRRLRWLMLPGHILVVSSVFFAHLHYTIDVLGAYAVAGLLFVLRETTLTRRFPDPALAADPK